MCLLLNVQTGIASHLFSYRMVKWDSYLPVTCPGLEADYLSLSSVEFKNEWSHVCVPPIRLDDVDRRNLIDQCFNKFSVRISVLFNTDVCFDVFLTVNPSIDFSKYQLSTILLIFDIYMLHYAPQHVSSSTLLIIRRTNCITTASGIVTLC